MSHLKGFFYFIFFHVILATPQLNLYNTDWVSESNNELQHNCFRLVSSTKQLNDYRKIISYCLSHLPSNFHLDNNDIAPKFTFAELSKQNVTSQQLYLWSASIDLIERYQFYLNQLSTSNRSLSKTDVFYNCTIQRFGPLCQYELVYLYPNQSSLYEIIDDFYRTYEYNPTTLTCYTYLKCNRGPSPMCLDWTEICNGRIDCLNDGADEEYCWQLEINECEENEYRCTNGQCIPKSFYFDNDAPACMDQSDAARKGLINANLCNAKKPSFECEDMTCANTFLTSSCVGQRRELLLEVMFSFKDNSVSEKCWSAIKCILHLPGLNKIFCDEFCVENRCIEIIENTCPDMFYFPNVPFFFDQIYLVYNKSDILYLSNFIPYLPYMCYNNSRYNDYFVNVSMISFKNITCFRPQLIIFSTILSDSWVEAYHSPLCRLYEELRIYNPIMNYTTPLCNKPDIYQCVNSSKCISIHRLKDNNLDCPHGDDENISQMNNTRVLEIKKKTYFKCASTDTYIPQIQVENYHCDCGYIEPDWCEDEQLEMNIVRRNISFQTICDGFVELASVPIEDRNETDETECQQWECNNIYTRCNGIWNCLNGADEAGCMSSSILNCSSQHHLCVSPNTNQFMCLSIDKANDGKIDCLGATDEPLLCRSGMRYFEYQDRFHCIHNNSQRCLNSYELCNQQNDCENNDDEQFCGNHSIAIIFKRICRYLSLPFVSDVEKFICERVASKKKDPIIYFLLNALSLSVIGFVDRPPISFDFIV